MFAVVVCRWRNGGCVCGGESRKARLDVVTKNRGSRIRALTAHGSALVLALSVDAIRAGAGAVAVAVEELLQSLYEILL